MTLLRTSLAVAALLIAQPAPAARPMVTDDARLTDSRSCQLESWSRRNQDSTELWALPACNLGERLELTFGGALGKDPAGTRTTDVVLQAKTLLRPLDGNAWGAALAVGNVRHPAINTGSNLIGDLYVNLPVSFALRDDHAYLHANLGWLREKAAASQRLTWGLGSETRLDGRNWLIAESYGQDTGRPYLQVGLRHWLVPGRMQVDATAGQRWGQGEQASRWFSLGLRLLSGPLLP